MHEKEYDRKPSSDRGSALAVKKLAERCWSFVNLYPDGSAYDARPARVSADSDGRSGTIDHFQGSEGGRPGRLFRLYTKKGLNRNSGPSPNTV